MGRLDQFKQAVQVSIEGEKVQLESLGDDPAFHIVPRKFSREHAAKIARLEVDSAGDLPASLVTKLRRLHKEHGNRIPNEIIEAEMTDEEIVQLANANMGDPDITTRAARERILHGVSWQDLSDEPGPMTEEIANLILESPTVTQEVLEAVAAMNPTSATTSSESSETSSNG